MTLLSTLRTNIAKRAQYRRTVQELRHLPLDVALDLDINPGDAERIAARAVYGNNAL
ncbi:hypothetical protein [Aestuariicoccus sp. MJ-SS9]|uniref:hypothetical protein n=1 Tax=Aestuariicoccus sp. MJ-SS9 TaxID=3079855 RepID=UPI00290DB938|nr:hypothetical protein [Aestuariicoccus sp. MJ-SS9]MDU8912690.1 hypothetical protein [Aestuariicoccus sp. MJ-SS9]